MSERLVKGLSMREYVRRQQRRFRRENPVKYHAGQAKYHLKKLSMDMFKMICNEVHKEKIMKTKEWKKNPIDLDKKRGM